MIVTDALWRRRCRRQLSHFRAWRRIAAESHASLNLRLSRIISVHQTRLLARSISAWRAFAVGEAASRRWRGLADDFETTETVDNGDGGTEWDDSRLASLASIVVGLSDSEMANLLSSLEPADRETVEVQLGRLQAGRGPPEGGSPPSSGAPPYSEQDSFSFCRLHQ
jgi:hypothetical protein